MKNETAVVLYSGGTDSTFNAVQTLEQYEKVVLMTYERDGLYWIHGDGGLLDAIDRVAKVYGADRVKAERIDISDKYKQVMYSDYIKSLVKHGFHNLQTCGMCKIAMDWATIEYCLKNDIKHVFWGNGREMASDPSQNEYVQTMTTKLYATFGIIKETPGYDVPPDVREQVIFSKGLTDDLKLKWQPESWKRQHHCTHERLAIRYEQFLRGDDLFINSNPATWDDKVTEYYRGLFKFEEDKMKFVESKIKESLK